MWTDCIQGLLKGQGRKLCSELTLEVLNPTKTQLYYLPRINLLLSIKLILFTTSKMEKLSKVEHLKKFWSKRPKSVKNIRALYRELLWLKRKLQFGWLCNFIIFFSIMTSSSMPLVNQWKEIEEVPTEETTELDTIEAENAPLVAKTAEKGDTRPQANARTYHRLAINSGGYHCVLIVLLLYGLSVGLCQVWFNPYSHLFANSQFSGHNLLDRSMDEPLT